MRMIGEHTLPSPQHREKLKRMVCSFVFVDFLFFGFFVIFLSFINYELRRHEQTRRTAPSSCLPLNNTRETQATCAQQH